LPFNGFKFDGKFKLNFLLEPDQRLVFIG